MKKKNWKIEVELTAHTKLTKEEVEKEITNALKYIFERGRVKAL